jgi:hypothetical protein
MKGLLLGLAVALLSASTSFAADDRDVTVVNGTGYGIKFLGFNNPGDSVWSDNELDEVLADGEEIEVTFDNSHKGCVWNFKIEWADPGYPDVLWRNLNLCTISKLTLKWDRATNVTTAITE